jgi:hypothetical protein
VCNNLRFVFSQFSFVFSQGAQLPRFLGISKDLFLYNKKQIDSRDSTLGNTMGQDRLNNCMILHCHQTYTDKVDEHCIAKNSFRRMTNKGSILGLSTENPRNYNRVLK